MAKDVHIFNGFDSRKAQLSCATWKTCGKSSLTH